MHELPKNLSRTDWAEHFVERFISVPFVAELVFRSLWMHDGRIQKEVVDFVISNGKEGIAVSQKCQNDPTAKTGERVISTAIKKAKGAYDQLKGAIRSGFHKPIWCNHRRRGRVDFPYGFQNIKHAIATVEVLHAVDLNDSSTELPLSIDNTPVTYLSVNDFQKLAQELRSLPDFLDYLEARNKIPEYARRIIGVEEVLFNYYLLHHGSFTGFADWKDALSIEASRLYELREIVERRNMQQAFCLELERVAHELAIRDPLLEKESEQLQAFYESADDRKGYLIMQEIIANLRFTERAALGEAFSKVMARTDKHNSGYGINIARLDSLPDFVFLFGSSKKVDRIVVVQEMLVQLKAAMSFYQKKSGLFILDRDRKSFDVFYLTADPGFPPEFEALGKKIFGPLAVASHRMGTLPGVMPPEVKQSKAPNQPPSNIINRTINATLSLIAKAFRWCYAGGTL